MTAKPAVQHSPTPWHQDSSPWIIKQKEEDDEVVATCHGVGSIPNANAAFIVRAVNSHDALVEAVNLLFTEVKAMNEKKIGPYSCHYEKVLAALKLAGEV